MGTEYREAEVDPETLDNLKGFVDAMMAIMLDAVPPDSGIRFSLTVTDGDSVLSAGNAPGSELWPMLREVSERLEAGEGKALPVPGVMQ